MSSIANNLKTIKENIAIACEKSGRSPDNITLIGVTKTIEPNRIRELVDLGVTNLGENRVQELADKYSQIKRDVNWHLIGHLQTNKVKYIMDKVCLIHSVDSYKLAAEINRHALKLDKIMDILIEINVAGEESKHGIAPGELKMFLEDAVGLTNIKVKGLMCIAPNVEKSDENRIYFEKMNKLFIDNKGNLVNNRNMQYLSMGMTNDYRVAIEEGANLIRIGTGLFH